MPWLMSFCFHVALVMIFMFAAMIAAVEHFEISHSPPGITIADGARSIPIDVRVPVPPKEDRAPRIPKGRVLAPSAASLAPIRPQVTPDLIGLGSKSELGEESLGEKIDDVGRPDGPDTIFIPPPIPRGEVADVVYLIDRSGSMIDTFDEVRQQMLLSISHFSQERRFHVVLFSEGRPLENARRSMVFADEANKLAVVKFLESVRAAGKTDPVPAINRAFDVVTRGARGKPVTIYLLTDGVFPDNTAVLETIDRRNIARRAVINTILYGNRPPVAEKVMKRIAAENNGKYRFVSPDE